MAQISTNTNFRGCVDSRIGGRQDNQDSCGYADTPLGLLVVVCDGMGGGPGGKTASSVAVNAIVSFVNACKPEASRKKVLAEAVSAANLKILNIVREKPALKGMGTTVTALLINEYSAVVAHVGDSRVYQFRWKVKKFRTFDHSMVFELVKNGSITEEDARVSDQANVITRALGHGADVRADISELPYEKGDRFMLCTDGVWGMMPEKELVKIVAGTSNIYGAMESLFIKVEELGFSGGGKHDNFSAALIETTRNSILKEKMTTKTKNMLIGLAGLFGISLLLNIFLLSSGGDDVLQNRNGVPLGSDSSALKSYVDSIKRLNDKVSGLERDTARLNGMLTGAEKGFKYNYEKSANVSSSSDKDNVEDRKTVLLKKLDEILKQLKSFEKGTANQKASMVKEASRKMQGMEKELSTYGCNLSYMKNCADNFKTAKSNDVYAKIMGEIKELRNKVKNYK